MALDARLRGLRLPAICAPMFLVSGPDLVREACLAGLVGALPRQNARGPETFDNWLADISAALRRRLEADPAARVGPLAVNLPAKLPAEEITAALAASARHGVELVISVAGGPAEIVRQAHGRGMLVFHDVTDVRFAEKAIRAGVDGLIAIGTGGGGHSGPLSHLALIPKLRAIYDGTIVMAGAITNGAAIRAAEILGADLAYLGTRFIATAESAAPPAYKRMLVEHGSADLVFASEAGGVPANWLAATLQGRTAEARPWRDIWSAGQGIDLVDDIPSVAELVDRLAAEYAEACRRPCWPS